LTQSAQSELEWKKVANHWENALELMKEVPPDHGNYTIAQDRVIQYQNNLDYANLAASKVGG
jgi:putative sterol carrier protein